MTSYIFIGTLLWVYSSSISVVRAASVDENVTLGLQLMFFRPREPLTMQKGVDNFIIDMPAGYENELYAEESLEIKKQWTFSDNVVTVEPADQLPDLTFAQAIPRRVPFSVFVPFHRDIAEKLVQIFLSAKSGEEMLSWASYARDRVNPYLYEYALSVALLHRPDTQNVEIPPQTVVFPEKFLTKPVLLTAIEESNRAPPNRRVVIRAPLGYSESDLEPENRLRYFREDLAINLVHWHWHLVNPPLGILQRDRRGELFYYFHQQVLARYAFERMCNGMRRVVPLSNLREPVPEGYFSKLDRLVASRTWPPRQSYTRLSDVNRPDDGVNVKIQDMERNRNRLMEAAQTGLAKSSDGRTIALNNTLGIILLGDMTEASTQSTNVLYYGNLHNNGHLVIGFAHDPDNRFEESFGVMGDTATSMRDPVFYRWHAFINNIFTEHKDHLPPYSNNELSFSGLEVISVDAEYDNDPARKNVLRTFWQEDDIDIEAGLDFAPKGPIIIRITHLQHVPFKYTIRVLNRGPARKGTVRIFLAPQYDERGQPLPFATQRSLMIELDRFVALIREGDRTVSRGSDRSTVTIPFKRSFRELYKNRPGEGTDALDSFNFCGCGWPEHMLIPRGTTGGTPAVLFVMISDYQYDMVDQNEDDLKYKGCSDSPVYCGIRGALYPDRRPMGYPFDRRPPPGVSTLAQFMRMAPNMAARNIQIVFTNTTIGLQTRSLDVDDW